jgi:hypothetical protein
MNWKQYATPAELERLDYIDNAIKQQGLAATAERNLIYDRCRKRAKRREKSDG